MPAVGKNRCRKRHPPWLLQDLVGEAWPIPMPDLRDYILLDNQYTRPLQSSFAGDLILVENFR
jgi:hypothetical protein